MTFYSEAGQIGVPYADICQRTTNDFAEACFLKPAEVKTNDLAFTLAPLILQEVTRAAEPLSRQDRFGTLSLANGLLALDRSRPAIYWQADTVRLKGKEHVRFAYVWCYSTGASGSQSGPGADNLPLNLVGTRSTASVTLPEENGTRWNASLPGSEAQANGLVCCFYRLANPTTLAMQWEAIAVNADFWSQVLQARSLKPLDFALGAVMATRRQQLQEIGGFAGLVDCLADDYQLGNRIARRGYAIALSPVVVECWSAPMGWADVWKHQLRWARTIRVCQPVPYFFSILSNATLWPVVWFMVKPGATVAVCSIVCLFVRIVTALNLQGRLNREPNLGGGAFPRDQTSTEKWARGDARPPATHTPAQPRGRYTWLIPVKDLLQAAMWLLAFLGNKIEWRGQRMRLRPDGTLERSKLPLA